MAAFNTTELGNTTRQGIATTLGITVISGAQRLLAAAAALLLGGLLTAAGGASTLGGGLPGADAETSEPSEHLVRRCKLRSKQELCYWAKAGSHHDAER